MKNLILIILIITFSNVFPQLRIEKLRKNQPVFGYINQDHKIELNNTRKISGSSELKRDSKLDSLALTRCLRYANLILNDARYISDTSLIKKEIHHDFKGLYKSENATNHIFGAGFTEKQLPTLTVDMVQQKITAQKYNPGIEYNNSLGHFKNRINPNWKQFGSAIVVIFIKTKNPNYDPNEISLEYIPSAIFLNYEVFD